MLKAKNVIYDYIYCIEYDEDDDRCNLIKVKTNGKKKKVLATNVDEQAITVVDEWVYFCKNENLYRVELDGDDREKISNKEIEYYQIKGKWIYYIYDDYIARMKLNGEDSQKIAKADDGEYFDSLYVKGNKVYYIMSKLNDNYDWKYYLCEMNKDGEKAEQICKLDENIDYVNMQEDKIYYTVTEDYSEYAIKSIKYNGTDKQVIKKVDSVKYINITEDWIIYLGKNDEYEDVIKMLSIDGEEEKKL